VIGELVAKAHTPKSHCALNSSTMSGFVTLIVSVALSRSVSTQLSIVTLIVF
jgi:hypothetical protein